MLLAACGEPGSQETPDPETTPSTAAEPSETGEAEYTFWDTEPVLLNGPEILDVLARLYPAELKEEGVGGRVVVWMSVDDSGVVAETKVQQSSGYPALDEAALSIADSMRFTPAEHDGSPVSVWIAQPIEFRPQ
jgi:TonB family protein